MNKKTHFGFESISTDEKKGRVNSVFSSVATNYDIMNDVMSFGLHRMWKKILIELAGIQEHSQILDLAGGTGDIAKEILSNFPNATVTIGDINYEMLSEGKKRSVNENFFKNADFCSLNGEMLPFHDNHFDVITIGFGLRNFVNKNSGLKEMYRCLKPDGKLLILEFSKPTNQFFSQVYDWYSFNILPKMGELIASDKDSYKYLVESIRVHPDQETLKNMMTDTGFKSCHFYNLSNGIVAIHVGEKAV